MLLLLQLVLALLAITGVFLLVPRGISVGTIEVHSTRMTFNSTTKTYRCAPTILTCRPPNSVLFYSDQQSRQQNEGVASIGSLGSDRRGHTAVLLSFALRRLQSVQVQDWLLTQSMPSSPACTGSSFRLRCLCSTQTTCRCGKSVLLGRLRV